jgi:hypothetical protein
MIDSGEIADGKTIMLLHAKLHRLMDEPVERVPAS